MFSLIRERFWREEATPTLQVTIETSSSTLSRSGACPFSITLHFTIDGNVPITVHTPETLLDTKHAALHSQGLVFTDRKTGEVAKRNSINICTFDDSKTPISSMRDHLFAEIPTRSSGDTHAVTHTFSMPTFVPNANEEAQLKRLSETIATNAGQSPSSPETSYQEESAVMMSDTSGLEVGSAYDITLGRSMAQVRWWRSGRKSDVLARGERSKAFVEDEKGVGLTMTQANTAGFSVVA